MSYPVWWVFFLLFLWMYIYKYIPHSQLGSLLHTTLGWSTKELIDLFFPPLLETDFIQTNTSHSGKIVVKNLGVMNWENVVMKSMNLHLIWEGN